jgi:antitoxin FitA
MPRSLHVRNLDDDLVRRLKLRAAENQRSVEAEHRAILAEALKPEEGRSFQELALELQAKTADRKHTPSEEILRISRAEAR